MICFLVVKEYWIIILWITGAQAEAQAIQLINEAEGKAFNYTQSKQVMALKNLADSLEMNNTQLIEYLKIRSLRDKTSGKSLKIGLQKPPV